MFYALILFCHWIQIKNSVTPLSGTCFRQALHKKGRVQLLLKQESPPMHSHMAAEASHADNDRSITEESHAQELVLAFCMGSCKRLGNGSLVFHHLDNDLLQMISQPILHEARCRDACARYLELMFPGRRRAQPAAQLKVGHMLSSPVLLQGRMLSKQQAKAFKKGRKDIVGPVGPMRPLADVVMQIRNSVMDQLQKDCEEDSLFSSESMKHTFYVELAESCRLLRFEELQDCCTYHDHLPFSCDEEDQLNGWNHPAHLFMPWKDENVCAHMRDLLEHICDTEHCEEQVPHLVSESLVLQACVFPVCADATRKVGMPSQAAMGSKWCDISRFVFHQDARLKSVSVHQLVRAG